MARRITEEDLRTILEKILPSWREAVSREEVSDAEFRQYVREHERELLVFIREGLTKLALKRRYSAPVTTALRLLPADIEVVAWYTGLSHERAEEALLSVSSVSSGLPLAYRRTRKEWGLCEVGQQVVNREGGHLRAIDRWRGADLARRQFVAAERNRLRDRVRGLEVGWWWSKELRRRHLHAITKRAEERGFRDGRVLGLILWVERVETTQTRLI